MVEVDAAPCSTRCYGRQLCSRALLALQHHVRPAWLAGHGAVHWLCRRHARRLRSQSGRRMEVQGLCHLPRRCTCGRSSSLLGADASMRLLQHIVANVKSEYLGCKTCPTTTAMATIPFQWRVHVCHGPVLNKPGKPSTWTLSSSEPLSCLRRFVAEQQQWERRTPMTLSTSASSTSNRSCLTSRRQEMKCAPMLSLRRIEPNNCTDCKLAVRRSEINCHQSTAYDTKLAVPAFAYACISSGSCWDCSSTASHLTSGPVLTALGLSCRTRSCEQMH